MLKRQILWINYVTDCPKICTSHEETLAKTADNMYWLWMFEAASDEDAKLFQLWDNSLVIVGEAK